jgi:hypothetical protein
MTAPTTTRAAYDHLLARLTYAKLRNWNRKAALALADLDAMRARAHTEALAEHAVRFPVDPAAEIEKAARAEIARKVTDTAARVTDARARLATMAAEEDTTARSLNDAVQRIAQATAEHAVWADAAQWLENHDRKGERTFAEWANDVVMHSFSTTRTDDGWSGRANDLRRVEFDAALEAKQHLAEAITKGRVRFF